MDPKWVARSPIMHTARITTPIPCLKRLCFERKCCATRTAVGSTSCTLSAVAVALPLKRQPDGCSATTCRFRLLNMRADVRFVLLRNGLDNPTLAAVSDVIRVGIKVTISSRTTRPDCNPPLIVASSPTHKPG